MPKSFRELRVWQSSIELTLQIYELTAAFPKHEVYGLTSQMRRAAVSISSNIAEGSARRTRRDFRQFVITAKGSNYELQTQLLIAAKLAYAPPERFADIDRLALDVGRMLNGLSDYLRRKQASDSDPDHVTRTT